MNCKYKSIMTKKKAFTLIELLIVIAIIGILFIVLVSKVDFATDKAKATGVQTDFRSFQMAFEHVAKENAGFTTFGWDQGDVDYDGVRDSRDAGDAGCSETGCTSCVAEDEVQGPHETFTGRKDYVETFNGIYSLVKSEKDGDGWKLPATIKYDDGALARLETAINANLDPKLHIIIDENGVITMANGAQDPWKTEYQGYLLTTDTEDDRGAIVLYSLGANAELGSVAQLKDGVVTVTVKTVSETNFGDSKTKDGYAAASATDNNKAGKDDYSLATVYTYKNGYGEVISSTTGFSNNQNANAATQLSNAGGVNMDYTMLDGTNQSLDVPAELVFRSSAPVNEFSSFTVNGNTVDPQYYTVTEGSTIVTLDRAYVAQLENGIHTVEIVSDNGRKASTELTIEYETFNFTIYGEQFTAKKGWNWADWILSYGISAGDNGIVWIGYNGHPLMTHGYLYYKVDGGTLGENQIILGSEKPMFNDLIQEADYDIDGPV